VGEGGRDRGREKERDGREVRRERVWEDGVGEVLIEGGELIEGGRDGGRTLIGGGGGGGRT
jgi:hypothetical protein